MRVTVTGDCAGTGQCVLVAPEIFRLDEDGLSTVDLQPTTDGQRERAITAGDLCPMAAIRIED